MALRIELDGVAHEVEILGLRPLTLRLDGVACVVRAPGGVGAAHDRGGSAHDGGVGSADDGGDGPRRIEIDGAAVSFTRAHKGARQMLRMSGRTLEAALVDPRDGAGAGGAGEARVRAPMPGAIIEWHKRPGEAVARGEAIVTIESMKLQMTLVAPRDGVVAAMALRVGDKFDKDAVVAELEPGV